MSCTFLVRVDHAGDSGGFVPWLVQGVAGLLTHPAGRKQQLVHSLASFPDEPDVCLFGFKVKILASAKHPHR